MTEKINKFVTKNWLIINFGFVFVLFALQLFKHFFSKEIVEVSPGISYPVFGLILILLSCAILVLSLKYFPHKYFLYVLIFCYLLMTIGYMSRKDPGLIWEGSDVANYNYSAGEESSKFGAMYLIETWNNRANPYVEAGYSSDFTDLIFKKYSDDFLKKISGDKWEVKSNLNVELSNNRPYMHPPVAPMMIGFWLKLFPYGRMSAQIFMIFLNIILLVVFYKAISKITVNNYLPVVLSFILSPVFTLYIQPSAEQIMVLMLFLSMLIYLRSDNLFMLILSGMFAGFAFYSKFIVVIFIFAFFLANLFYLKGFNKLRILYYIFGVSVVVLFFTLSGYYFWLTIITGQAMTEFFVTNNPVTISKTLSTFLYFGMPFYLFVFLGAINMKFFYIKDKYQLIFIVSLVTVIIYVLLTFEVGTFNRYLIVFIPGLLLGAAKYFDEMKLGLKEMVAIPVCNVLLLIIIAYL